MGGRGQDRELGLLAGRVVVGHHRHPPGTEDHRPDIALTDRDWFGRPAGHPVARCHHQELHRASELGSQVREISGPREPLVGVDFQLDLDDDREHHRLAARQHHQVGVAGRRLEVGEVEVVSPCLGVLRDAEAQNTTQEPDRELRPVGEQPDQPS
jgi:hypothetical protein